MQHRRHLLGNLIKTILTRPVLAVEAVVAGWAFRARRSLIPSRELLSWRIATAYGSTSDVVQSSDVVDYLEWRRAMRRAS